MQARRVLQVAGLAVMVLTVVGCASQAPLRAAAMDTSATLENPAIDMPGFLSDSAQAAAQRETHRLTEAEFIAMSHEPGTLVLDARSAEKYRELHIKGAMNLSFPDIAIASLELAIPDKATRILIYCNNNFVNAEGPFPSKMARASLNLSTYVSLYTYGYRNVYELGPQLDPAQSALTFESGDGMGDVSTASR
jgi:phage shock protein E